MVRAERPSLLHESPTELAARVEGNHIWMDRYGGDHGLAALTQQSSQPSQPSQPSGGEGSHHGDEKKSEPVLTTGARVR
jgi:hypothetical protein